MQGLGRLGTVGAVSSLFESAPVGGPEQPPYLNAVVSLETELAPVRLLLGLQQLEQAGGRRRGVRFGPRTLDLDLLLYGAQVVEEPGLEVPHPRLSQRRFVVQPLTEVWPQARLPNGPAISDLLPPLLRQEVRRVAGPEWARGWADGREGRQRARR